MTPTTDNRQPATDNAVRHAVYGRLLDYLPVASYDQARQFVANLRLVGSQQSAVSGQQRERKLNAALMRFINLRVTPDVCETAPPKGGPVKLAEIETWLNKKYGDRLASVAGFYRRNERAAWRLNLPTRCALYGYRSAAGFYNGILCQPLNRLDSFFLLSSTKFGGSKAVRLTPRDQQYFTQYEEVTL